MFIFFIVQTSQKTSVNIMSTNSGIVEGNEMTNRDEETADVSPSAKWRTIAERGGTLQARDESDGRSAEKTSRWIWHMSAVAASTSCEEKAEVILTC